MTTWSLSRDLRNRGPRRPCLFVVKEAYTKEKRVSALEWHPMNRPPVGRAESSGLRSSFVTNRGPKECRRRIRCRSATPLFLSRRIQPLQPLAQTRCVSGTRKLAVCSELETEKKSHYSRARYRDVLISKWALGNRVSGSQVLSLLANERSERTLEPPSRPTVYINSAALG